MIELILPQLRGVQKAGNGYNAYCPSHDDRKTKSLHVEEQDGRLLMFCFAGCDFSDIIKKLDLPQNEKVIENTYDYVNEEGEMVFQVVRFYPKSFSQRRPFENTWKWDLNGVERVLYNLPEVIESNEVFFVEGEKDVETLRKFRIVATTLAGGVSAKWLPQYTETLKGRNLIIIPDNDEPGIKHAKRVAHIMFGWCKVKIVLLPDKDITDFLKSHATEELYNLINETGEFYPDNIVTREELQILTYHVIYLSNFIKEHTSQPHPYKKGYKNYK